MELYDHSASELTRLLTRRKVSSKEITESVFNRIEERETTIHELVLDVLVELSDVILSNLGHVVTKLGQVNSNVGSNGDAV